MVRLGAGGAGWDQGEGERCARGRPYRQQEKIATRTAAEQASGKRKRGPKPKPAEPTVDPDALANPTDPDSEMMKTRRSWVQDSNAQAVVTAEQIIPAASKTEEFELFIATQKDHKQRADLRCAPAPRKPKTLSARGRMERKLRTKRGRALSGPHPHHQLSNSPQSRLYNGPALTKPQSVQLFRRRLI